MLLKQPDLGQVAVMNWELHLHLPPGDRAKHLVHIPHSSGMLTGIGIQSWGPGI